MSKIRRFRHFLGNRSFKVFDLLHDGRRQKGASFECGVIFGKNINLGLIRGLNRD